MYSYRPALYLCDLDGTLLTSKAELREDLCIRINQLLAGGTAISFVTGRDHESAHEILAGVKKVYPYAVNNGSLIVSPSSQQIMQIWPISSTDLSAVLDICKGQQFVKITGYADGAIIPIPFSSIEGLHDEGHLVISITLKDEREWINSLSRHLLLLPGICAEIYDDPYNNDWGILDITSASATKRAAVEYLAQYCGYNYSDVIAFGDSPNDIPMFKTVGVSCYVGSEIIPEVFSCCNHHLFYDEGYSVIDFIEARERIRKGGKPNGLSNQWDETRRG